MRVYYDEDRENIVLGSVSRYLRNGSLIAEADGDNVRVRYLEARANELYANYSKFKKQDDSPAGSNITEVVDYLNGEFNKDGKVEGDGQFSGLNLSVDITDNRLTDGDIVIINPTINALNELYFPSVVVNNQFTVRRVVINTLGGLTGNLPFKWRKLR